jgi:hypothetical protein
MIMFKYYGVDCSYAREILNERQRRENYDSSHARPFQVFHSLLFPCFGCEE